MDSITKPKKKKKKKLDSIVPSLLKGKKKKEIDIVDACYRERKVESCRPKEEKERKKRLRSIQRLKS